MSFRRDMTTWVKPIGLATVVTAAAVTGATA